MAEIRGYDSLDEMFADMRRKEEEANKEVLPLQREVTWGSHWITYYPAMELFVFGYCMTRKEVYESEIAAGGDSEEAEQSLASVTDAHSRGYRFGWAYSVIEPTGEIGSTHIAAILGPISVARFKEAQEANWQFETIPHWLRELWDRGNREYAERRATSGSSGDPAPDA